MKNIVMVEFGDNPASKKKFVAELPATNKICSGDSAIISTGKRLSAPSFMATAISDSIQISDDAANWLVSQINQSAGKRYYVKGINRTEIFIW